MRRVRGESGAAAVEFALVAPLLFMLLFGIVQFGIAYNRSQGLQAAAHEGARLASIGASYDDITARVQAAQSLFQSADLQVTTVPASSGATAPCQVAGVGGTVTVTASVAPNPKYAITIPLWGNREISYDGSGTFRCERTAP